MSQYTAVLATYLYKLTVIDYHYWRLKSFEVYPANAVKVSWSREGLKTWEYYNELMRHLDCVFCFRHYLARVNEILAPKWALDPGALGDLPEHILNDIRFTFYVYV